MTFIEDDFWAELDQIQAESIGWIPLDEGAGFGAYDACVRAVVKLKNLEIPIV